MEKDFQVWKKIDPLASKSLNIFVVRTHPQSLNGRKLHVVVITAQILNYPPKRRQLINGSRLDSLARARIAEYILRWTLYADARSADIGLRSEVFGYCGTDLTDRKFLDQIHLKLGTKRPM